jgi:hypothetical protein
MGFLLKEGRSALPDLAPCPPRSCPSPGRGSRPRRERSCKVKLACPRPSDPTFSLVNNPKSLFPVPSLFFAPAPHLPTSPTTSHHIAKMAEVPDAGTAPMEVDPAASIGEKITIVSITSDTSNQPSQPARARTLTDPLLPTVTISYPDMLQIFRLRPSA